MKDNTAIVVISLALMLVCLVSCGKPSIRDGVISKLIATTPCQSKE